MKTKPETIGKALSRDELKKITGGTQQCSVFGYQCEEGQCCSNSVCIKETPTTLCDF